jgi:uncharacterized membrane protein YciS (DUF1049 family)
MTDITDVKLKNGKEMKYFKSNDKHVFFNNIVAMSNWQLIILVFIVVSSILMTALLMTFIGEGFNKILFDLNEIHKLLATGVSNSILQLSNETAT